MERMFLNCISFNQPLDNWDVSRVRSMRVMFENCENFNQDLTNWNVSSSRNFVGMFRDCVNFNINPNWQLFHSASGAASMFANTPLQGTVLQLLPRPPPRAPRATRAPSPPRTQQEPRAPRPPRPPRAPRPPAPGPQGIAFEIHNAFPELNFTKFMTIIRKDNNGASNFKDATYPLQPLIAYINNDRSTTLDATEKTSRISDLNGEIKTRLNMYLLEHPETKNNVREMIQFIMSQGPEYKDPYIRFLTYDCMNAYGPGGASCTKGIFERVF